MGYEMVNRSIFFFLASLVLLVAGNASQAYAKTIYVSTSGNNNNPGTQSQPVATPHKAVELAASGDTIYLRAGRYTISSYIWVAVANLTISSYPGEQAAVVGGTAETSGNPPHIFVLVANNIVLSDLEIQGGSYYGIKIDVASGDERDSTTGITIRRCYVHHTGRDSFKTFNADNLLIEECEIGPSGVRDSSNAEGIDSIGSVGVTIRKCYVHDTATTGIYLKGGARNGVLERNRIVNAGHTGILLGQDTDFEFMRDGTVYEAINCVARNNVIINTLGAGVGTYSGDNIRFENNTLYDVAKTANGGLYISMNSRDIRARDVVFKNNIVVTTGSRPMVSIINQAGTLTADNNIWYRPSGTGLWFYREFWANELIERWDSFSAWQNGINTDRNSRLIDPRLDSASMYKPAAGSPAIDRGETLSSVAQDYSGMQRPQGAAYDIGAHEVASSGTPSNQPPTVSASASVTSGPAPLAVSFTATASDPDGQVVSYSWSFGDGSSSSQASSSHTYQTTGSYTARVTVTDDRGATASASVVINVSSGQPSNKPPTVSLTATPMSGGAPLAVSFTATASDPDGQVVSYKWDFGNGQTSTQQNPSHTYSAGSFAARVTVTDNGGATASATVTINATNGSGTTTANVIWKNVVGCSVSGNSLTKTAESLWGNAGASSTQSLQAGNGYLQFTATETNLERMCGLSNSDPDQSYISINFAIHLNTGRAFYVYESGIQKGYFGDYNPGDVFRVAVESGVVKYYRNNTVFYTSTARPTYPLIADATLNGRNSTITNAIISGGGSIPAPTDPPEVIVVTPNGGEVLKAGNSYQISWQLKGSGIFRQDIQLTTDGGNTWREVVGMLPGSAISYTWTVPDLKNKSGRIRIIVYGGGGLVGQDTSNADFFITKVKTRKANK
jgi:PKD repeat protein